MGEDKKTEEGNKAGEDEKIEGGEEKGEAAADPPPPPPPPEAEEIVMRVYMHCEGCARKVRRCLRKLDGVEEVTADCRTQMVVVKGRKAAAEPMRVVEIIQRKSGRRVELLSPIPPPPKPEEEEVKVEEKPKAAEEEPQVIIVVMRVHMHCDACAQEIKKRILKKKGVQEVEPDLKTSLVTVKGVFEPAKLAEYLHRRTGKHVTVMKQEPAEKLPPPPPEPEPTEQLKEEETKEEKTADDGEKKEEEKGEEEEKPEKGGETADAGDEAEKEEAKEGASTETAAVTAAVTVVDGGGKVLGVVRKNELYYYYPRHQVEYAYPPQIFSDENPNACVVM